MPDTRVGALDHPERYGSRSLAVYANSTGYYFKLDGAREKVHGAQLWTTLGDVKMRGAAPVGVERHADADAERNAERGAERLDADRYAWPDDGDDGLAAAIAASLQDVAAELAEPAEAPPAGDAPPAGERDSAPPPEGRACSICLTEPVCMLMRPCNHVCACAACARRLGGRACPICRRAVRTIERVFL